ncbi:MAG: Ni/Fe hydrogenase subunit alpha, partial [Armatimonadetes bacterium]|nr:Ni/Fe hydrogenase subunit alpha [Armatimonadota bacterium]
MSKEITIKPVTRIEGHAKVTLQLDDAGEVTEARFHVMELRGFEKFMEGRMFWEAPLITPRICGICSVSHHLAAAKACD